MNKFFYIDIFAFLCRLLLIAYGEWQDKEMVVKYTDIDYKVFTDAAKYMYEGKSPFLRKTYRYTPILAWLLQPNVFIPIFGKLLFSICDILVGLLIRTITFRFSKNRLISMKCSLLWLFNPLTLSVSTRGNCESIISFLVLLFLYILMSDELNVRKSIIAGLIYGLSVHVKIYPIVLAPIIYLNINWRKNFVGKYASNSNLFIKCCLLVKASKELIWFTISAFFIIFFLTFIFYVRYGDTFINEAYLYHISRKDIRHNFSPFFYLLYLTQNMNISIILFLPQLVLTIFISCRFYKDLLFGVFLLIFCFVCFNKVCTSQYFLWYLSLLPLIVPNLNFSIKKILLLINMWLIGQGIWLYPAYLLEFRGMNTFLYLCISSNIFLSFNTYIICQICSNYFHNLQLINSIKKIN